MDSLACFLQGCILLYSRFVSGAFYFELRMKDIERRKKREREGRRGREVSAELDNGCHVLWNVIFNSSIVGVFDAADVGLTETVVDCSLGCLSHAVPVTGRRY